MLLAVHTLLQKVSFDSLLRYCNKLPEECLVRYLGIEEVVDKTH